MADESLELEDGEVVPSVVQGPSAADVQLRARLHEAATVLRQRGQRDLARLALGLVDADPDDAMWVLNDQVRGGGGDFSGDPRLFDAFRHMVRRRLLNLQEETAEHEISEAFPVLVAAALGAAHLVAATYDIVDETTQEQPYRDGGFGSVPACAAAVRSLEKQTFHADGGGGDVTECSICFDEFTDGAQVTVMPCPSHVHKFHPDCITKWLAISNMCPLCRCELPADYE